jgi:hypothetical protein
MASAPIGTAATQSTSSFGFIAAGLGMLIAALLLLHYFTHHSADSLPYYPLVWMGGPLLLVITFLAVCGAFLICLRRFSLAGLMTGALAAGVVSISANQFIAAEQSRSVRPIKVVPANIRRSTNLTAIELATSEPRLRRLANAAVTAGYVEELEFERAYVEIREVGDSLSFNVAFDAPKWYGPTHGHGASRDLIEEYCHLAYEAHMYDLCQSQNRLMTVLMSKVQANSTSQSYRDAYIARLSWLDQWETDEEIKNYIGVLLQNANGSKVKSE